MLLSWVFSGLANVSQNQGQSGATKQLMLNEHNHPGGAPDGLSRIYHALTHVAITPCALVSRNLARGAPFALRTNRNQGYYAANAAPYRSLNWLYLANNHCPHRQASDRVFHWGMGSHCWPLYLILEGSTPGLPHRWVIVVCPWRCYRCVKAWAS